MTKAGSQSAFEGALATERILSDYATVPPDTEEARDLRRDFIRALGAHQTLDAERDRVAQFLVEHIRPEDLGGLEIRGARQAAKLCELLLSFRSDTAEHSRHIRLIAAELLKSTLLQYEQRKEFGKLFKLAQFVPNLRSEDPELLRLRSIAHLYEMRRAGRLRSWLYTYMCLQAVLVTVIFPLLFVNAENGRIQSEFEQATSIDVQAEAPLQNLTYADGLYWSVITATSIGYGDVTPGTRVGRVIAALLGTLGVVTVGVMAGLILFWIRPRTLHW